jgi:putative transposase
MPDHPHMIWTLPDADADYATRIRLIKTAFTKDFLARDPAPATNQSRAKKGEREVWQRRYWEHMIRDERDFHRLADYIHYNPVEAGLAKAPSDWPHSTFRVWAERGAYAPGWGVDWAPEM